MDAVNPLPEHTEVQPLGTLPPPVYIAAVRRAASFLRWRQVNARGNELVFQTQSGQFRTLGERVTITIQPKQLHFTSKSVNDYYWRDNQNAINAEQFRSAFARALEQHIEHDKQKKLDTRYTASALVLSREYLVAPILIYLNVGIFLIMAITGALPWPSHYDLINWGGNARDLIKGGQWWRLFTYMFLHGGLAHIAGNMFALAYISAFLEPLMGRLRFIATYILTGIFAGVVSIAVHPHSIGVGASGAIFGMYGFFLALLATSYIQKAMRQMLLRSMLFFVVFNLIMGMQGNVDNAAHIGGLVSGFIIGRILYPGFKAHHTVRRQAQVIGVVAVVVLVLSAVAVHFMR